MKNLFLILTVILTAGMCSGQSIHEPSGRVKAVAQPDQCGPIETPWGAPCSMIAADCDLLLVPMFVNDVEHTTKMRVVVSYSSRQDVSEVTVPWTVDGPMRFTLDEFQDTPRRIQWFSKHVDDAEYPPVAVLDCWCDADTGEIQRCVNGVRE